MNDGDRRTRRTRQAELLQRARRLASRGRESAEELGRRLLARLTRKSDLLSASSFLGSLVPVDRLEKEGAESPWQAGEPGSKEGLSKGEGEPALGDPEELALSPSELARVDQDLPELPGRYDDLRVVLLPRDPGWLYAYWELSLDAKLRLAASGGRLALRLHDVTDLDFDGQLSWRQTVHPVTDDAGHAYLQVPEAGRTYLAELGILQRGELLRPEEAGAQKPQRSPITHPSGLVFTSLAHSEGVQAPLAGPSPRQEDVFTILAPEGPARPPREVPATFLQGPPSTDPMHVYPAGGSATQEPSAAGPPWGLMGVDARAWEGDESARAGNGGGNLASDKVVQHPGVEHLPWSGEHLPWSGEHLPWSGEHLPWSGEHLFWSEEHMPWSGEHLPWSGEHLPWSGEHLPWSGEHMPWSGERIEHMPWSGEHMPWSGEHMPWSAETLPSHARTQTQSAEAQLSHARTLGQGGDAQSPTGRARTLGARTQPSDVEAQPHGARAQPPGPEYLIWSEGLDLSASQER